VPNESHDGDAVAFTHSSPTTGNGPEMGVMQPGRAQLLMCAIEMDAVVAADVE
jgi:hypothetical protein